MTQENTNDRLRIDSPTKKNTTGPYGEKGCEETLHVVIDGKDVFVPWTSVRRAGYDYRGDVPETFDVDRILLHDGHIHAEADVKGGVVELIPQYNPATAEFKGYDAWRLELFDADAPTDATVVFERPD